MKPLVSVDELRRLMPNLSLGKADYYAPFLNAAMLEQGIVSKRRRCAFLSQLAHESAQLRYMEEIASGAAYEGRKDLGNIHPGDGKKYKGRGPIQLTGRANYRQFGLLLGVDFEAKPELAAKPEYGFRVAALFWKLKGLNELADDLTLDAGGADYKIVRSITRKINGGYNGLDDRWAHYKSAIKVLHNDEDPTPSPVAPPIARPAETVADQAESPAEVSADTGNDLLGAAVNSATVKQAAPKLWPRIAGLTTYLFTLYQANQLIGNIIVLAVLVLIGVVVYWKWKAIKAQLLKVLK